MLSQLVYISRADQVSDADMGGILAVARRKNRLACVTGLLLYDGAHFVQLLEGHRVALSNLFLTIAKDPRHQGVTLVSVSPITARDCSGWAMGYVHNQPAVAQAVERFSTSRTFDPHTMDSQSVTSLLLHVAAGTSAIETTDP